MPTTTIPAIDRQLDFRASPERLWRALTDDGELGLVVRPAGAARPPGGRRWLARVRGVRPRARPDRGLRAGDPAVLALGRRRQVGRRGLDAGRVPARAARRTAGRGSTCASRASSARTRRWSNTEGWVTELAELAKHVAVEPFEAGIRRTYALTSPLDRVWRAFSEPAELGAWWAGTPDLEIRAGYEGWFVWPSEGGRFAMRFEAVEPPRYLCWTWTPVPDVPLAEAETRCCAPSGPSSRARTAAPTSTCSRAASPSPTGFGHEQRRLGRRHRCRRSADTSARL